MRVGRRRRLRDLVRVYKPIPTCHGLRGVGFRTKLKGKVIEGTVWVGNRVGAVDHNVTDRDTDSYCDTSHWDLEVVANYLVLIQCTVQLLIRVSRQCCCSSRKR